MKLLTSRVEYRAAHKVCSTFVPRIITDCPPLIVETHLHSTLVGLEGSSQSQITSCTHGKVLFHTEHAHIVSVAATWRGSGNIERAVVILITKGQGVDETISGRVCKETFSRPEGT